jgi:hypothetical protein
MLKVLSVIFLALLIVGAVLIEQKRINNDLTGRQGRLLRKVNAAADELIQSCGRPQHESAMSSPSPQLTYDSYHLTITIINSRRLNPIFVDTETDNQISRESAARTMPCLAHWLSQESLAEVNARH